MIHKPIPVNVVVIVVNDSWVKARYIKGSYYELKEIRSIIGFVHP